MAKPPPRERLAEEVPGYGARLGRLLDKYGVSPTDLAHLSCLSSSTIARALKHDRASVRTRRRIDVALAQVKQARRARHGRARGPDSVADAG